MVGSRVPGLLDKKKKKKKKKKTTRMATKIARLKSLKTSFCKAI
jgi:hypothetical protein